MGMSRMFAASLSRCRGIEPNALRGFGGGSRPCSIAASTWDSSFLIDLPVQAIQPRNTFAMRDHSDMSTPSLNTRFIAESHRLPSATSSAPSCFLPAAVSFIHARPRTPTVFS